MRGASPEEQEAIYERVFQDLSWRDFLKLRNLGHMSEKERECCLIEQGETLSRFMLISRGRVSIRVDNLEAARLGPGNFLGERSFITEQPTSASVWTLENTRYIEWPGAQLKDFLERSPDLRSGIQVAIGSDLVGKLRASGKSQS